MTNTTSKPYGFATMTPDGRLAGFFRSKAAASRATNRNVAAGREVGATVEVRDAAHLEEIAERGTPAEPGFDRMMQERAERAATAERTAAEVAALRRIGGGMPATILATLDGRSALVREWGDDGRPSYGIVGNGSGRVGEWLGVIFADMNRLGAAIAIRGIICGIRGEKGYDLTAATLPAQREAIEARREFERSVRGDDRRDLVRAVIAARAALATGSAEEPGTVPMLRIVLHVAAGELRRRGYRPRRVYLLARD
jgi:hypothetical protein